MTKKDYIKIASILKRSLKEYKSGKFIFSILVDDFCEALRKDNTAFDKNKFIEEITDNLK